MIEDDVAVLHTISGLHPHSGGTSRVVVDVTDALTEQPCMAITLLTQSLLNGATISSDSATVSRVVAMTSSRVSLTFGLPLLNRLKQIISTEKPSLIHNHGLWQPVNHWAASMARRHRIPLIMQPHGMLEPWALEHKGYKKRIAMAMFQRSDLKEAKVLVATSSIEHENIRRLGFQQPIAVIPNGLKIVVKSKSDVVESQQLNRVRNVLFLSRVHPVKGVLNLVHAWAKVEPQGWKLLIAGPDESGHIKDVLNAVKQLRIGDSVEYLGEIGDERKSAIYRSADLFVLPTFSENFGVVVAEALAHGLPVITTRGAPWSDLETYCCGWWVEIGVDPLVKALREGMELSDETRSQMGERGRQYAQRYNWEGIAEQTAAVYKWVLGIGSAPKCIRHH